MMGTMFGPTRWVSAALVCLLAYVGGCASESDGVEADETDSINESSDNLKGACFGVTSVTNFAACSSSDATTQTFARMLFETGCKYGAIPRKGEKADKRFLYAAYKKNSLGVCMGTCWYESLQ